MYLPLRRASAFLKLFIHLCHRDSDTEKNETEEYTDEPSKIDSSMVESEDVLTEIKKRGRRGKFGPFAQVVNFMGKNGKRN